MTRRLLSLAVLSLPPVLLLGAFQDPQEAFRKAEAEARAEAEALGLDVAFEQLEELVAGGLGARPGELEQFLQADERMRADPRFIDLRHQVEWRWLKDMDSAYDRACYYASVGKTEYAFAWLDRAVSLRWGAVAEDVTTLTRDPRLAPLRSDPRFRELADRTRRRYEQHARALAFNASPDGIDPRGDDLRGNFRSVSFSPDGSEVLVASYDRTIRVLDAETGQERLSIPGHTNAVLTAAFSPDGAWIASGSSDATAAVWGAKRGESVRTIRAASIVQSVAFSPDGRMLATAGYQDYRARIWDARTGEEIRSLPRHDGPVWSVSFSPDGRLLVSSSQDGTARIRDLATGEELLVIREARGTMRGASFDPRGGRVLINSDQLAGICDAETGELLVPFERSSEGCLSSAFSPDGRRVVTACQYSRSVYVWNAATGEVLTSFDFPGPIIDAAFNPSGDRLVMAAWFERTVSVWDADTAELVWSVGGETTYGTTAGFSPDGTRVAVLRSDRAFEWDLSTGAGLEPVGGPRTVDVGADQPRRAWRDPNSYVWEKHEARHSALDAAAGMKVSDWYASPDGARILLVSAEPGSNGGYLRGTLWDAATGERIADIEPLKRPLDGDQRFPVARFSPDGRLLACMLRGDDPSSPTNNEQGGEVVRIVIVRAADGTILSMLGDHLREVTSFAFDNSGTSLWTGARNGIVRAWDVASAEERRRLPRQTREVGAIAIDPSGRYVATGSFDTTVRLWDARQATLLAELSAHRRPVASLDFSPDGTHLVSTCWDETVRLWDVEARQLLATGVLTAAGEWLCFTPQAYYVGDEGAARGARMVVSGQRHRLADYAVALHQPAKVAEALSGAPPPPARVVPPPRLFIAEPPDTVTSTSERSISFRVTCEDPAEGVDRIDLWVDGARQDVSELLTREGDTVELALTLPVQPVEGFETTVRVQGVSSAGIVSRELERLIRYEPATRECYVLAIGVADYRADDVPALEYPLADVDAICSSLLAQEGGLYSRVRTKRMQNEDVSVGSVRRAMNFLLQARAQDTIIVFIAGHGVVDNAGDYYLLTVDDTLAEPQDGVSRGDMERLVLDSRLQARRRLMLLDTCRSGTSVEGGRGETRGEPVFDLDEVNSLVDNQGIYILAASSEWQYAIERAGNGIFTRAVVHGWNGAADSDGDGYVRIEELKNYVDPIVREESGGRQTPTFPTVIGGENFRLTSALGPK